MERVGDGAKVVDGSEITDLLLNVLRKVGQRC